MNTFQTEIKYNRQAKSGITDIKDNQVNTEGKRQIETTRKKVERAKTIQLRAAGLPAPPSKESKQKLPKLQQQILNHNNDRND